MTQQKSENPIVPQDGVTPVPSQSVESDGGGKGVPDDEQMDQLELFSTSAATPTKGTGGTATTRVAAPPPAPSVETKGEICPSAMMTQVARQLTAALKKVASNRGAPGPDGETVSQLRKRWNTAEPALRATLFDGSYRPGEIRRKAIPKPGGGERKLGIPNVIDRVVQEAMRAVLEPLYEPMFHTSSHGFRPGRSCHTAIREAQRHVEDGYGWVVDIDLEKFFDRVHHQRLMARLAQRVQDRPILVLIGRLLKAGVVLPDGVVVATDEGVPQGGPLSPLLSNIVLDELDWELSKRGHRFVRYADDCNVFLRSERAGHRVMNSLTDFIKRRLRLRVNEKKSAVARPSERHFLGFRLVHVPKNDTVEIRLSKRTRKRIADKIRELTPRNWGSKLDRCIGRMNRYLKGWHAFFGICSKRERQFMKYADAHIRRRMRAILLKHWKRRRTIARNLIKLGVKPNTAWRSVYAGRKSTWKLSLAAAVNRALSNAFFAKRKLQSLAAMHLEKHKQILAPAQLTLKLG